jgi:hypothetical protein
MATKRKPVILTEQEKERLERISRSKKEELRRIQRATIILMAASGVTNKEISGVVKLSPGSVSNTIQKFLKLGIDGALADMPRGGRPRIIDDDAIAWILSLANRKPKDFLKPGGKIHHPEELWSIRMLREHVLNTCGDFGHVCLKDLSPSKLWLMLKKNGIKLGRIRGKLPKTDPKFPEREKAVIDAMKKAAEARRINEADGSSRLAEDERTDASRKKLEQEVFELISDDQRRRRREEAESIERKHRDDELKRKNREELLDMRKKLEDLKIRRLELDDHEREAREVLEMEHQELKHKIRNINKNMLKKTRPTERERMESERTGLEERVEEIKEKLAELKNETKEKKRPSAKNA